MNVHVGEWLCWNMQWSCACGRVVVAAWLHDTFASAGPLDVPPTARPLPLRCPTPTTPLPTQPTSPFSLTGSSLPAATSADAGAAAVTAVATTSVGAAATQGNIAGTATASS